MTSPWFPDTEKWPVEHPDRLQLYTMATPNGQKVSIALEETGLPYEWHLVNIREGDQHRPDYLQLSPNGKIPTILDPDGPGGQPLVMMESGAILLYLAEKTGQLIPRDARGRLAVQQWLFFQMAHVGPMFGQFGHFFKFAREQTQDDYAVTRYTNEAKRLLGVLDARLETSEWLAGDDYSVADIATGPWVNGLTFYGGEEVLELASFNHVLRWQAAFNARPAVQRGRVIGQVA